jgi:hypothetical protein
MMVLASKVLNLLSAGWKSFIIEPIEICYFSIQFLLFLEQYYIKIVLQFMCQQDRQSTYNVTLRSLVAEIDNVN